MSDDREGREQEEKEEQEEGSFVVKDRRRFTSDGEERDEVEAPDPPAPEASAAEEPAAEKPAAEEPAAEAAAQAGEGPSDLPAMDFGTFVISLARSALMHMEGQELPDGSRRKDVEMARQTIDILAMLKEKTEGNLSEEEAKMMESVLYDLRMAFLQSMG